MAYGRKERFDKRAGVCHNEMHGKIRLTMLDQTDRSNAFFIKGKGRRKVWRVHRKKIHAARRGGGESAVDGGWPSAFFS